MLASCSFLFEEVTEKSLAKLTVDQMRLLETWVDNGARPTIAGLRKILRQDALLVEGILDYLQDAPLYECVEAGGNRFILVHSGLGNFHPNRPLDKYMPDELLWERPTPDTVYFPDATVIFGHTPTEFFGEQYRGRAIKTESWICIDTGAAMGNSPMILRLDDGKEFY